MTTLTRTSIDVQPPFGPAVVGRGLSIQGTVRTQSATTGAWTAKDISDARWIYRLRVWLEDDDTSAVSDEVVSKGSASSSGEIDHYHACGTTVRAAMTWELVEVDDDNADASTSTGKRERIVLRWQQPVIDAPIG